MTPHLINLGLQIVPRGSRHEAYWLVDRAIEVIQASGLRYLVTPFETVIEGPYAEAMEVAQAAQQAVLEAGAEECLVYMRLHYRSGGDVTFEEKRLAR